METSSNAKQFMEGLAGSLRELVVYLVELIEPGLARAMEKPLLMGITGADLLALAVILLLVIPAHALVREILRRNIAAIKDEKDPNDWRALFLDALHKPLFLVLWAFGFYLALTTIVMRLGAGEGKHPFGLFVDKIFDLAVFFAVYWLFFRLIHVFEVRLKIWASGTDSNLDDVLAPLVTRSLRVIIPVIAVIMALPVIGLPDDYDAVVKKGSGFLIICAVAWVLCQAVIQTEKIVLSQFDIGVKDNLRARKIYTQVHVLKKSLLVIIAIFTIASILMLFEEVRRLGTSILASAGVLGIIFGFAAQRTIANLFAGFQLAMTQPIRIDDVVIVENEWGRIEEITLTYVVVRIWDQRRLVVPISHFIERPFQNWTRTSADILGSVFVHVDYTAPLDEIRKEAGRIVESCEKWDRKFWNMQVTNATDRTLELRILATAADASIAWDLRCEIREKLISYIQKNHPQSLPKVRADVSGGNEGNARDRIGE